MQVYVCTLIFICIYIYIYISVHIYLYIYQMLSGVSIMSSMSLKKLEAMLLAMLPFLMWCPSTDSAKNSKKNGHSMHVLC